MGEREREAEGVLSLHSNLPHDLDRFGFKGIFQRVGRVSNTYISS